MKTTRLTTAQALIRFLKNQYVERDGQRAPFFAGCFGIFGHGNVAGIGQALQQNPDFRYYQVRNEQAMVHSAAAYAKHKNRLQTFACTTSVGPGATNMVTAAAGATINRLPVLLLPGDVFARRHVDPVLQQLESPTTRDVSVNDCFRPISKYWDRIWRPEQLLSACLDAMRVLTSPSDTGAVTLAMPQDVQADAFEFPNWFFEERTWHVRRPTPDAGAIREAALRIREAKRPLIVAGGGVIYANACAALARFCEQTGIAIGETQAGKGALPWQHAQNLGAIGATGTLAANRMAKEADLIIGVGTRYSDFTTQSQTLFSDEASFVNINVASMDVHKQRALGIEADAREALNALRMALRGAEATYEVQNEYKKQVAGLKSEWDAEVNRLYAQRLSPGPLSQAEVIGAVNDISGDKGTVICAAGSLPGDLHKLWRPADEKGYHLEYGYSCMGYEVAAGLGVAMAEPERDVFVMVGDGSYLMMAQEIVTAVQEGVSFTIVLLDNHGYGSIGALSESLGSDAFGTRYKKRGADGQLSGPNLEIDFVANAASMGAKAERATTHAELRQALERAKSNAGVNVVVVETSREPEHRVPGYESWWNVPVAEVSEMPAVRAARKAWEGKT